MCLLNLVLQTPTVLLLLYRIFEDTFIMYLSCIEVVQDTSFNHLPHMVHGLSLLEPRTTMSEYFV